MGLPGEARVEQMNRIVPGRDIRADIGTRRAEKGQEVGRGKHVLAIDEDTGILLREKAPVS